MPHWYLPPSPKRCSFDRDWEFPKEHVDPSNPEPRAVRTRGRPPTVFSRLVPFRGVNRPPTAAGWKCSAPAARGRGLRCNHSTIVRTSPCRCRAEGPGIDLSIRPLRRASLRLSPWGSRAESYLIQETMGRCVKSISSVNFHTRSMFPSTE